MRHRLGEAELAIRLRAVSDPNSCSGNSVAVGDAAAVGLGVAALPSFLGERSPSRRRFYPEPIGTSDIMLVAHPALARLQACA